ncbi:hypothetical protein RND81_02G018600 [Saponaria officinalis]|uniref:Uncharacterized protein n=1 Tax=Saponaria officinalis TaxID=3572 RepID=A0AAW1MQZ1_SAPOF
MVTSLAEAMVAAVLFIILSPGMIVSIPGENAVFEFFTKRTSRAAIVVHSFLYFAILWVLFMFLLPHMNVSFKRN